MTGDTAKRQLIKDILALGGLAEKVGTGEAPKKTLGKLMGAVSDMSAASVQFALLGDALGRSLGWKTGKSKTDVFVAPYAIVALGLFLAFDSLNYPLATLFDTPTGAFVEARLPIDLFSMGGVLKFDLFDEGAAQVRIVGTTKIEGATFDLGKSKRAPNDIFARTQEFSARLLSTRVDAG